MKISKYPLEERNKIVPQMRDYDLIGDRWVPYIMRMDKALASYPSVSTDEHGFRQTLDSDGGTFLTYRRFFESSLTSPRAVLLGSSAAFGVGATSDRSTIPSILNQTSHYKWFNLGGRALNSTQEMLLFLLHLPHGIKKLVIFSGVNNLTLSYVSRATSPVYNSFFFQSVFERVMSASSSESKISRSRVMNLLAGLKDRFFSYDVAESHHNIDVKYASMIKCLRRDLEILKLLGRSGCFEVYFVLQPLATWIEKDLVDEEKVLFSILDKLPLDWQVLATYLSTQKTRYVHDVNRICGDLDIPFINLNESNAFAKKEWLFVDRIHLTDRGYQLSAETIQKDFDL